ncbi:MAG TPA: hypothetical protein VM409_03360, partial [Chloroflexia bacterium]|nr:hypothetical protein [Chloroflexia bacterium]
MIRAPALRSTGWSLALNACTLGNYAHAARGLLLTAGRGGRSWASSFTCTFSLRMTTTTGRQEPNAGELLLERLVPEMQSRSWLQAAAGLLATQHPDLLHYMTDERVADWRFLLPDLPAGSTLCAGGALSPAPILLAASGARVVV